MRTAARRKLGAKQVSALSYRKQAEEALERAAKSHDLAAKRIWLEIAKRYEELAKIEERNFGRGP